MADDGALDDGALDPEALDLQALDPEAGPQPDSGRDDPPALLGLNLSFRTRLTIGLVASSIIPLAAFGAVLLIIGGSSLEPTMGRILLFVLVVAVIAAVLFAYLLAADLTAPLRAIAAAVERTSAGDLSTPIGVPGDDELARLADSHNRLAADLERRNRELGRILAALEAARPGQPDVHRRPGGPMREPHSA